MKSREAGGRIPKEHGENFAGDAYVHPTQGVWFGSGSLGDDPWSSIPFLPKPSSLPRTPFPLVFNSPRQKRGLPAEPQGTALSLLIRDSLGIYVYHR